MISKNNQIATIGQRSFGRNNRNLNRRCTRRWYCTWGFLEIGITNWRLWQKHCQHCVLQLFHHLSKNFNSLHEQQEIAWHWLAWEFLEIGSSPNNSGQLLKGNNQVIHEFESDCDIGKSFNVVRAIILTSCCVWETYEILRILLAEVHDVHKSRSRYVHFWLVIKHINPDTSLVIKWIHSDRCTRQSYNFAWQLIVRCTQKLLLPTWNFALFWFCRGICFKFWF